MRIEAERARPPVTPTPSFSFYVTAANRIGLSQAAKFGDALTMAGRKGPATIEKLRAAGFDKPVLFDGMGYKEPVEDADRWVRMQRAAAADRVLMPGTYSTGSERRKSPAGAQPAPTSRATSSAVAVSRSLATSTRTWIPAGTTCTRWPIFADYVLDADPQDRWMEFRNVRNAANSRYGLAGIHGPEKPKAQLSRWVFS